MRPVESLPRAGISKPNSPPLFTVRNSRRSLARSQADLSWFERKNGKRFGCHVNPSFSPPVTTAAVQPLLNPSLSLFLFQRPYSGGKIVAQTQEQIMLWGTWISGLCLDRLGLFLKLLSLFKVILIYCPPSGQVHWRNQWTATISPSPDIVWPPSSPISPNLASAGKINPFQWGRKTLAMSLDRPLSHFTPRTDVVLLSGMVQFDNFTENFQFSEIKWPPIGPRSHPHIAWQLSNTQILNAGESNRVFYSQMTNWCCRRMGEERGWDKGVQIAKGPSAYDGRKILVFFLPPPPLSSFSHWFIQYF